MVGLRSQPAPASTTFAGVVKEAADVGATAAQTQGAPSAQTQNAITDSTGGTVNLTWNAVQTIAAATTDITAAKLTDTQTMRVDLMRNTSTLAAEIAHVKNDVAAIKTDIAAIKVDGANRVTQENAIRTNLRTAGEMA